MGIKQTLRNSNLVFSTYKKMLKIQKKLMFGMSAIAPVWVSKTQYKSAFKRKLDLKNPVYFNEKLMWLKFKKYKDDPLVAQCADKYAVREYIESCGLSHILNELYGAWDRAEDIPWDELPEKFAIKCNHGCGFNLICRDKSKFDTVTAGKTLNKWLKTESWREYAEVHYRHIPPKIICEKFLSGKNDELPVDYKLYCFNGKVLYIGNFIERNMEEKTLIRGYFDLDWNPSPVFRYPMDASKFSKPINLEKMIEYAEILSKPFPFVRVDFYEVDGQIVFGELTFTPTGCLGTYYTDDAHRKLGDALRLAE